MPLIKSSSEAAFKQNVAEMRRAGHPRAQALAASYRNQADAKAAGHDDGGGVGAAPGDGRYITHFAHGGLAPIPGSGPMAGLPGVPVLPGQGGGMTAGAGSSRQIHMHGLIHGPGTGRSDSIHMTVPKGGYMVPADIVSGIGHGSSLSGARALDHSFPMNINEPFGRSRVRGFSPLMGRPFGSAFTERKLPGTKGGFAQGGDNGMTDIMGSEGEYFIHPHAIIAKYGNLKRGHSILDQWIQIRRKKNIREQRKLKPPKGAKKI